MLVIDQPASRHSRWYYSQHPPSLDALTECVYETVHIIMYGRREFHGQPVHIVCYEHPANGSKTCLRYTQGTHLFYSAQCFVHVNARHWECVNMRKISFLYLLMYYLPLHECSLTTVCECILKLLAKRIPVMTSLRSINVLAYSIFSISDPSRLVQTPQSNLKLT